MLIAILGVSRLHMIDKDGLKLKSKQYCTSQLYSE